MKRLTGLVIGMLMASPALGGDACEAEVEVWNAFATEAMRASREQNHGVEQLRITCPRETGNCSTSIFWRLPDGRPAMIQRQYAIDTNRTIRRTVCATDLESAKPRLMQCEDYDTGAKVISEEIAPGKWNKIFNTTGGSLTR